jgi:hypothetical protein
MEPMSYWPVELAVDAGILYVLSNSKNVFEITVLVLVLLVHATRQWKDRDLIKEVSIRKHPFFILSLIITPLCIVWATRTLSWPMPILIAALAGIAYYWAVKAFGKDSGKCFKLFDPKIDLPQLAVSGSLSYLAVASKNPVGILWLTDFVYHILEAVAA